MTGRVWLQLAEPITKIKIPSSKPQPGLQVHELHWGLEKALGSDRARPQRGALGHAEPCPRPQWSGQPCSGEKIFFLKQLHTKHSQSCGNPQRCNKK